MFNPNLNTRLSIDGVEYSFTPHPAVPSLVWAQEGRHATVYRVQDKTDAYGLKVFRPAFRHPGLITTAESLWTYHELPGMLVCKQAVITREGFPELVAQYEDLDYAMVMPWIAGDTWFDILGKRQRLTLDQSRALAESMAWVLYALELNQLAHCDLSSGNVIIDPHMDQGNLVDVEDLYSPWLEPPPMLPAGSAGYQHKESGGGGQWAPTGDRFAGVILMAEMLGWAHPDVRKAAWGESYFAPDELQKGSPRFDTLLKALQGYHPGFAETFEATWRSEHLEDCPPLKTWYDLLDALPRDPVASWAPINQKDFQDELEALEDEPNKPKGFLPAGPAQPGRTGCRVLATIGAVILLFTCCAATLAAAWTFVTNNTP
jgi:serine/threonine protein kinase